MTDDTIVQYYIVQKDLDMSVGKTAAQCAHASQYFTQIFNDDEIVFSKTYPHGGKKWIQYQLTHKWNKYNHTKIILGAKKSIFEKIKEEVEYAAIVTDAGFTEIESGTETVIVLHPMLKINAPKIIQKLRLL